MADIKYNRERCRKLIEKSIEAFSLNLKGYTILTEAATGYYAFTPMIAALAAAKRVYLIAGDSRFGKAKQVSGGVLRLAADWGLKDRIAVLSSRRDIRIKEADIVTNLGFVRPLNKGLLSLLKPGAVIPLMWETWEYRPEDMDILECRRLNIPVLGTNEQHRSLRTFEYLGYMAAKILFESELELFSSRVAVLGDRRFGYKIARKLNSMGARAAYLSPHQNRFSFKNRIILKEADALIIADFCGAKKLIGNGGVIGAKELFSINPGLLVAHICGAIDGDAIRSSGLRLFPEKIAEMRHMSLTLDFVGPRPLIDLHTAGLKVAEEMVKARLDSADAFRTELAVLKKTKLAQGFAGYHFKEKGA